MECHHKFDLLGKCLYCGQKALPCYDLPDDDPNHQWIRILDAVICKRCERLAPDWIVDTEIEKLRVAIKALEAQKNGRMG